MRSAGMRGSSPATRPLRPGDARRATTRGLSQMRRAGWGRLTRSSAGGRPQEARREPRRRPRLGRGRASRTGASWEPSRSWSRETFAGCWVCAQPLRGSPPRGGQRHLRGGTGPRLIKAGCPTGWRLAWACPGPTPRKGQGGRGGREGARRRTRRRGTSVRSSGNLWCLWRPVHPAPWLATLEVSDRAGIRRVAWGLRAARTQCEALKGPPHLEEGQRAPRRCPAVWRGALRRVVGGRR